MKGQQPAKDNNSPSFPFKLQYPEVLYFIAFTPSKHNMTPLRHSFRLQYLFFVLA